MTPKNKFILVLALPVVTSTVISFFQNNGFDDFKNLRAITGIFVIFLNISIAHVFVFDKLYDKSQSLIKALISSYFAVFVLNVLAGFAIPLLFAHDIEFWIPLSQGMISTVFLTASIFLDLILQSNKQKFTSHKNYGTWRNAVNLIGGTTLLISFLFSIMSADMFLRGDFPISAFLGNVAVIIKIAFVNSVAAYLILIRLLRIKWWSEKLILTILITPVMLLPINYAIFQSRYKDFSKMTTVTFLLGLFITVFMLCIMVIKRKIDIGNHSISRLQFAVSKREAEYVQLKNQINPHFLFNNLNTLISFIETEPAKAVAFGQQLSGVYRHFLKTQPEEFVTLSSELAFVKEYLEVYQAKFCNSFTFKLPVLIESNQYILSSSLQELIDNFFKHNEMDETSQLHLQISIEGEYLKVANTTRIRQSESNGQGLINIEKRYKILTGLPVKIEKTPNFTVRMPILKLNE